MRKYILYLPTANSDCTNIYTRPTVAGISGNPHDGAWSVALSGGYPDEYAENNFLQHRSTESNDY